MILADEGIIPSITTSEPPQWRFKMECDKCKGTIQITAANRETAQRIVYEMGWRANFNARKYIHMCKGCVPAPKRKGAA